MTSIPNHFFPFFVFDKLKTSAQRRRVKHSRKCQCHDAVTKSRRHDSGVEDNALPAEVESIHWELSNTKTGTRRDNYVDRQRPLRQRRKPNNHRRQRTRFENQALVQSLAEKTVRIIVVKGKK